MAGTSRKKETMEQTKKAGRAGKAEDRGKGTAAGGAAGRGKSAAAGSTAGRGKSAGSGQASGSRKKAEAKKDSSARQAGSSRRRTEEYGQEKESFMGTEVAIIVTFAVSVLLFLSNFGLCGAVGNFCRGVMLGIFGTVGYLAPVLFFIGLCFYISNRGNIRAAIKLAAVGILLLAICGLDQMLFGGGMQESWSLGQYYTESGASGNGGGFLGGLMVVALCSTVGTVGAYLVLLVALAVAAVCITEKSLVNFVKRGSGRAYEYAREDMSRRRELHEERKEEKRRLREEQRVKGVDLGSATLQGAPSMREFVSEIPEERMLSQEESGAVAEAEPMMAPAVNPADVFRGRIQLPNRSESVPEREHISPARQEEQPEPTEPALTGTEPTGTEPTGTEPTGTGLAGTGLAEPEEPGIPEEADSDQLLKQIYVRRDTRTVAELSGGSMGAEARQGPGYYPVHTEPAAAWSQADWTEPEREETFDSIGEDGAEYPAAPDEEWIEAQIIEVSGGPEESGLNYDSFYIPEEPKTVVTASGKVIDTDTELVRKTVEKKREARRQLPDSELSVSEQIEKKTEAEKDVKKEYVFPPINLLKRGERNQNNFSEQEYKDTAIKLQQTLQNFGVGVTVTNISCGPSVTRYELHPEQGVKVSKIVSLADDIKLNLAASDIRIEAPIPGKAAVGIEVPNKENNVVFLRELLESEEFKRQESRMAFAVGKDIGGQAVVSDIARMPHLLIAGATGSGKSVCINTLIMSIIYKARPEEVKLIMIDPKVVELSVYNGIPHLLIPVVTDPKKASGALNWAVAEMMDRYAKFAKYNVRDLKGFNAKVDGIQDIEDEKKPEKLPQIIIIVDELADLMMVAPGEVEDAICRLAQLARAAGIHLVIATQRPSVNVITGVIKANIPSRIAFSVSSGVDSRTIIDMHGAEKLLGKGDMLFYPSGYQKPQRVQGAFVSDQEVSAVVDFLTEQGMEAQYSPEVESRISTAAFADSGPGGGERDAYFVQAGRFIIEKEKASIGMLQRMFKIGFNRAARIMDQLADAGVVGEEEGTKPRKVLMSMEQFEEMLNE